MFTVAHESINYSRVVLLVYIVVGGKKCMACRDHVVKHAPAPGIIYLVALY